MCIVLVLFCLSSLFCIFVLHVIAKYTTGWPNKVSHYQVSSLNRINNRY